MPAIESKRLGDILNFKRGYDLPASKRQPGEYPVISSSGISGYHSEYKADGEGIVTGRYGTLGTMYYINGKYWPHNTALYVTDFKGNYPKYVYYLLTCLGRMKTSDKSTVPGVNRNEIHEVNVPCLPRNMQENVANALSSLDQKIDTNNRINAKLEAMAKTLYNYWFVQFDFPDENGKPYKSSGGKMVYNETLKREIPEGWVVAKLCDKLQNVSQSIQADQIDEATPYTPIDSLPIKKMSFGDYESSLEAKTSLIKYQENDILIGAMRVYFHRVCIAPFDGVTRTTTMVLRSKNEEHMPYLYQVCNEERLIAHATKISGGTQQPYVNWENRLSNYKFAHPKNLVLAEQYSEKIRSLVKTVIIHEKENRELKKLRDWLLPMLMNGQVKVEASDHADIEAA